MKSCFVWSWTQPAYLEMANSGLCSEQAHWVCKCSAGLTSKVQDDTRAEGYSHVANEWPHPGENGDGRPHYAEGKAVGRPDFCQVGVRAVSPGTQRRS